MDIQPIKSENLNLGDIAKRIKGLEEDISSQEQVARLLGFNPSTFTERKKTNSIPFGEIWDYCQKRFRNIEYILTGRGEKNTKSWDGQGLGGNLSEEEVEYQIYKQMLHENLERVLEEGTQKMKLDTVNQINGFIKEMRAKNVGTKGWFFKKGKDE